MTFGEMTLRCELSAIRGLRVVLENRVIIDEQLMIIPRKSSHPKDGNKSVIHRFIDLLSRSIFDHERLRNSGATVRSGAQVRSIPVLGRNNSFVGDNRE